MGMLRKHCWYYKVGIPTKDNKASIRDGILYSQSPKALILKLESRGFTVIEVRNTTLAEYKKFIIEMRVNDLETFDVPLPQNHKLHPQQIARLTVKYSLLVCFVLLIAYIVYRLT